jgi:CBS domain-containing protein
MRIKEVMSHPVITCPTDSTLDAPARLMWEFDCGIVPVVGDDGRLAGVVTDRDVCMAAYTQGQPLARIPVTKAMSKQVLACHEDEAIEAVEQLMRDNQIRRVPVIDSAARPVGLVSLNDLARLAAGARKSAVDRHIVETLAAVCQPRPTVTKPNLIVV